jgi:tRNA nucleotidyltransferase (CCA-adding enzyme)
MLFHDMGKPAKKTTDEQGVDHFKQHAKVSEEIARTVLRRLKFDNETIRLVCKLVKHHDDRFEATPANVRRAMHRIGVELFPYYLAVRMADAKAQSMYQRKAKIQNIIEIRKLYQQILKEKQCVTLKDLCVTGRDLMDWGMQSGRELGEMLDELLALVIEDPSMNDRTKLCDYVKEKRR